VTGKLLFALVILTICLITVWSFSRDAGYLTGYREGLEHGYAQFECDSCETRPCAFGPGIVGVQRCGPIGHKWARCEPEGWQP
jgi:hypothetical protein